MLALSQQVYAQNWTNTNNIWELIESQKGSIDSKINIGISENIQLFRINKAALNAVLSKAPKEYPREIISEKNKNNFTILQVPMPEGTWQNFLIKESPVMHPVLAEKFPEIKAYRGIGIEDQSASIYFDNSPLGFHGMVLSEKSECIFIEPLKNNDDIVYKIFSKKETKSKIAWECYSTHEHLDWDKTNNNTENKSSFCGIKIFRLAIACTGEYAQYHGGTKALALAAMHSTLTRVNGIFERDLSISLQMVADNEKIIFLNPYSDPFSNNNAWEMLEQNQQTCDQMIGENNYDIGHVFSTNGGGLAQVRSLCKPGLKARGATGIPSPENDFFNIDYVAHELGHQFGANHTQNNNCNRYTPTAVEPGSGSSIMGYAGICAPNVQSNSDAYFHAISINEILNYLENDGDLCGEIISSSFSISADAGLDHYIPKSTPFILTGNATTVIPSEHLLYNWEQMNNEISFMPPNGLNHVGPLFRSVPPTVSNQRYFPSLHTLIKNEDSPWEVLPNCERVIDFIFSARCQGLEAGCSDMDNMAVHVVNDAGPFKILESSLNIWNGGTTQTINWDVSGTNSEPVNCQFVDILLSIDGGFNYQIELASQVPNNGSHQISVPNIIANKCRIMVKAGNNIFFDINDDDIIIQPTNQLWADLQAEEPKCVGENNGKITANGFGGNGAFHYEWSTGETGSELTNINAGNYTVTIISGNLSLVSSIVLHDPPPIKVDFEVIDVEGTDDKILKAVASGGTGIFTYKWLGDSSQIQTRKIYSSGEYEVEVIDQNGCSVSRKYTVEPSPENNEATAEEQLLASRTDINKYIHAYPNPCTEVLQLEFFQSIVGGPVIRVYDILGRELYKNILLQQEPGLRQVKMNMTGLKNGIYILEIEEGSTRKMVRVLKI